MRTILRLSLVLLFASALGAQTPLSMTPTSGPTSGGTEVTIKGDFDSVPFTVFFGSEVATSTTRIDEHTLRAVTPAHLPGKVEIVILELDMLTATDLEFEFIGGRPSSYERLLLPVFTPAMQGAFGAEFHTDLRIANHGVAGVVDVFGLRLQCRVLCPTIPPDKPLGIPSVWEIQPGDLIQDGAPGKFIYVRKAELDALAMNLRVHDVTRDDLNFGTEIPIVRENEFLLNRVVLVGVPTDPHFRNTLRIYGDTSFTAHVKVGNREPVRVRVEHATPTDIFLPAYGVFSDFPTDGFPVRVTIDVEPDIHPILPIDTPIWAFLTVTNNDTQMISTITPQP